MPLKLARKCVDVFGYAAFDEDLFVHTLNPGCDDEIATVTAGKEFALLKTVSGKVNSKLFFSVKNIVLQCEIYFMLYFKGTIYWKRNLSWNEN